MARVNSVEGIRYGFGTIGYMLGVVVFGLLFFVVGFVMLDNQSPGGGIVMILIGASVLYAGFAGTTYKVIADAVDKGTQESTTPTAKRISSDKSSQETAEKVRSEE